MAGLCTKKELKIYNGVKTVSSISGVGKMRQLPARWNGQLCTPYLKGNSVWIKYLHVRLETCTPLKTKQRCWTHGCQPYQYFCGIIPSVKGNKRKTKKLKQEHNRHFPTENITCHLMHEELLKITNHQGNAHQNHNELSLHRSQNGYYQKDKK